MLLRLTVFLYFIFFSNYVFSKEIPIIVISAGKTPQSYSSVGSQVTIIDSETIEKSSGSTASVIFIFPSQLSFQSGCI